MKRFDRSALAALCALGVFALTACGGADPAGTSAADASSLPAPAPKPTTTPGPSPSPSPTPSPSPGPVSVTVTWTPPALNVDGTALTDVSGYRVFYGTSPSVMTQSVFASGAGAGSAVISGLSAGTYYFSVATVNSAGTASDRSNPVQRTVP